MNDTQTAPQPETQSERVPAASVPPKRATASEGTVYLVLKKSKDGKSFETVNTTTARTTDAAIKAVVEKLAEADQAGTYVAVVASRWTPVEITPKVERSLVLKAVQ